ncbi:hypothetical protein SCLCIDRAFT_29021 [Scleroderma citrinum Foug A]|uniref:Uncharacterized protein n=1 Tax=Scleroderma citrinum Foug A TaxID=1036808 RepID=A0A0C2ZXI9_9AGAM|nr:hypothetical protein SCLCIDRAFT_29021 [Scleroderma citrinum Foug A]
MVSSRAMTPQAARVGKKLVIIESPIESEEDRSPSPSSASESSLSSLTSEVPIARKIPKPSGEAGRPGRGGYNLQDQLGWSNEEFKTMKRFVHKEIKKRLDLTKCRSLQERKAMEVIRDLAITKFPDLNDFEDCWPVLDLIQLRLKYTLSKCRKDRNAQEERAKAGKKSKRPEND